MILSIGLPLALATIMFALGLGLTSDDFRQLVRNPKAFALGTAVQLFVVPIMAFLVATSLGLPPELALGLVIVGLCPGGATSNIFCRLAHGDVALSVSLTAVGSLICVVSIPVFIPLVSYFYLGAGIQDTGIASLLLHMLAIVTVPIIIGMLVRAQLKNPRPIEALMTRIATAFTVAVVVGALIANFDLFLSHFVQIGLSMLALIVVLMITADCVSVFFGLGRSQRTAIVLGTGIQNATLGIAVGAMVSGTSEAIPAVSLPAAAYGILMYLVCGPYVVLRRWQHKKAMP